MHILVDAYGTDYHRSYNNSTPENTISHIKISVREKAPTMQTGHLKKPQKA